MTTNNEINIGIPISVSNGGTGSSTLTGVMVGAGTSLITVIPGSDNQTMTGQGAGVDPTFSQAVNVYMAGISFDSGSDVLGIFTEGTFTPTLHAASGGSVTYSYQVGTYMKIAGRCFVNANVALTAFTAGTGQMNLSPMPFSSLGSPNNIMQNPLLLANTTFTSNYLTSNMPGSTTGTQFNQSTSGAGSGTLINTGFSNTSVVRASIIFETA